MAGTVASGRCEAPSWSRSSSCSSPSSKLSDPANRTIQERRERLDGLADLFPLPDDVERTEIELGGVPGVRLDASRSRRRRPPLPPRRRLRRRLGAIALRAGRPDRARGGRRSRSCPTTGWRRSTRSRPRSTTRSRPTARCSTRWTATRGAIVVGGDSAGGGLAVAAVRRAPRRRRAAAARARLLSPWLDLTCTSPSWDARFEGDPVLDHSLRDAAERYLSGADPRDPLCSPLFADLSGLPPILVLVGTHEILYDDAVSFADAGDARRGSRSSSRSATS